MNIAKKRERAFGFYGIIIKLIKNLEVVVVEIEQLLEQILILERTTEDQNVVTAITELKKEIDSP
ncbi:hypothetical protein [Bacillus cereus group sp. MYBK227-1]|uniref:hypothetical protein n=1 Tax=Bacillus cereus group sp. MYBK227-1 TaxID=3450654 RepID=UPI003F79B6A6